MILRQKNVIVRTDKHGKGSVFMDTTIRFRQGSTIAWQHNMRDKDLVSKEEHIDPEGVHEIWGEDRTEFDVYEELFSDALQSYNDKQKIKSRRMTLEEYYNSVRDDTRGRQKTVKKRQNGKLVRVADESAKKGKKTAYELIYSFGSVTPAHDDAGAVLYDDNEMRVHPNKLPDEVNKNACKEYHDTFEQRNPNFRLIRTDWHDDEGFTNKFGHREKSIAHAHTTYVPFGTGYKQGLSIQASMGRALKEMGYEDGVDESGRWVCAYEKWANKEREYLEGLVKNHYEKYVLEHEDFANERGNSLNVKHPVAGKNVESYSSEEFKALQSGREEVSNDKVSVIKRERELDERAAAIRKREDTHDKTVIKFNKHVKERDAKDKQTDINLMMREQSVRGRELNIVNQQRELGVREAAIKQQEESLSERMKTADSVVEQYKGKQASLDKLMVDNATKTERALKELRIASERHMKPDADMEQFLHKCTYNGKDAYEAYKEMNAAQERKAVDMGKAVVDAPKRRPLPEGYGYGDTAAASPSRRGSEFDGQFQTRSGRGNEFGF